MNNISVPVPKPGLPNGHPVLDPHILSGLRLLEADAGTGKTWTIARLVLRAVVEKDIGIDRIAVLTFTNAAANELRERIGELFDQWLTDSPDLQHDPFTHAWESGVEPEVLHARLRLARLQLDQASIATIHGFCQRVMTENSLSIGRWDKPQPGPSDPTPLLEAVALWWRTKIVNGPPAMATLCGPQGLSRKRLTDILRLALHDSAATIVTAVTEGDIDTLPSRLIAAVAQLRESLHAEQASLVQWFESKNGLSAVSYKPAEMGTRINEVAVWLAQYPGSSHRDCPGLKLLDRRRIDSAWNKSATNKGSADAFRSFDDASNLVNLLLERSDLSAIVANQIREQIRTDVLAYQRHTGTIGFDDLLQSTAVALRDSDLGEQLGFNLRNQFALTFIDEFQDTDPAQWSIFESIYRPASVELVNSTVRDTGLILVGDPKQAIYSFRNADVFTYLHAKSLATCHYRLAHNHRSGGELIGAVNAVHRRELPFATDQIEFRPACAGRAAELTSSAPPDDSLGALTLVSLGDDWQPDVALATGELSKRAVSACSNEIGRLIDGGHAMAGDIAVLVPTVRRGKAIRDGLLQRGIGAVEISRDSVFATNDARDLFRLISAIAAPSQNDLVRGALITALIGFDLRELDAVSDDPLRWQELLLAFGTAAHRWRTDGPEAALRAVLFGKFRRAASLAAVAGGERRLTNVLHLLSLLASDPAASANAAQGQAWLGRQIEFSREPDEIVADESQLRLDSDENLVSILTIHVSKGLQFPFVFLPFTWAGSRAVGNGVYRVHDTDDHSRLIVDGSPVSWFDKRVGGVDPERYKGFATQARFQESLRLNYVALTRAQRRCYACWGPLENVLEPSAMTWLLDSGCAPPGSVVLTAKEKRERRANYSTVVETMQALAADQSGVALINWESMRCSEPPDPRNIGGDLFGSLQLSNLDHHVGLSWQTRSFTSMARLLAPNASVDRPDHDQDQSLELVQAAAVDSPSLHDDFSLLAAALSFPRGANAGTCLHEILETATFTMPIDPVNAASVLTRYGIQAEAAEVAEWLTRVLQTSLIENKTDSYLCLSTLANTETIRELSYTLSVGQLNPRALTDCIGRHYDVPNLAGSEFDGYLSGFIDLVVRARDGRYWLLDYKSNWLGESADNYDAESLTLAMSSHAYHLQMCLYCLAVHRMLRVRQPNYDYDTHFGGAWYLFLRGMDGGASQRGVYTARPPKSLIVELDHIVGGAHV